jgi:hypothetical protein
MDKAAKEWQQQSQAVHDDAGKGQQPKAAKENIPPGGSDKSTVQANPTKKAERSVLGAKPIDANREANDIRGQLVKASSRSPSPTDGMLGSANKTRKNERRRSGSTEGLKP